MRCTHRMRQAAWEGRAQKLGAAHFRTLASAKRLLPLLRVGVLSVTPTFVNQRSLDTK